MAGTIKNRGDENNSNYQVAELFISCKTNLHAVALLVLHSSLFVHPHQQSKIQEYTAPCNVITTIHHISIQ